MTQDLLRKATPEEQFEEVTRGTVDLQVAEELTRENRVLTLTMCVNYGGRAELADTARSIARDVAAGRLDPEKVDERTFAKHLYVPELADAALVEPLSCAVRGYDVLSNNLGAHVLIYGAGTMGLMMLQLAKRVGAASVEMVDLNDTKLAIAQRLGCTGTATSAEGTVSHDNPVWVAFARAMAPMMRLPAQLLAELVGAADRPLRVIDVAADIFPGAPFVPLVVGAPVLGRFCVFGNLFARFGREPGPYRLDRHPSMSRHPTTPADESASVPPSISRSIRILNRRSVGSWRIDSAPVSR